MAKINNIKLTNFRNFKSFELSFINKCNIFFGENGSGKTNILESISLLNKGKGFKNASFPELIKDKQNNFFINSKFEKDDNIYDVNVFSKKTDTKFKKITSVNNETSKDSLEFIYSSLSYLIFLPEMERLFLLSPSYRRNFIDKIIFSENKSYNKLINSFKKYILERSKLLQMGNYDTEWILNLEQNISKVGLDIYNFRIQKLIILNEELISINKSKLYPFNINLIIKDDFFSRDLDTNKYLETLKLCRTHDSKFGGCQIGPHKSDFKVNVNDNTDASRLSTGQQKTIVLMILIAQCNYLIFKKKIKPILLFDEMCSHLDHINRKILLELTDGYDIQSFITGTEESLFSFMSTNVKFYNIVKK